MDYIDTQEFRELGLLQEVNRIFFHPLGLAMEAQVTLEGNDEKEMTFRIQDHREDPEGVIYGKNTMSVEKHEAFQKFRDERHAMRLSTLGYIKQRFPKRK